MKHTFDLAYYGSQPAPKELKDIFRDITIHKRASNLKWGRENEVIAFMREALNKCQYDLVWVTSRPLLVNIPKPSPVPILADIIDSTLLEKCNYLLKNLSPFRSFIKNSKSLLKEILLDFIFLNKVDQCMVVTEKDARWLRYGGIRSPIAVINNGVDNDYFRSQPSTFEDSRSIVFEGNLDFPPNTDAALFFYKEIFPLIQKDIPTVRLILVGKNPTKEILALSSRNIQVTGYVDDIRPYLDRAAVFVCPIRIGAGIKNKILQAWSMSKATVATTISTSGLKVSESENIIIRDNPAQFAQAVTDLLLDPKRRERIGKKARQTILDHCTWEQKAAELESLFESMIKQQ